MRAVFERAPAGLLLVDARHPGLDSDVAGVDLDARRGRHARAVVATKIDKLGRGERIRALRAFESVFENSVLPVSAVTGEGLDELWTLIDRILSNSHPRRNRTRSAPKAQRRRPARRKSSSSRRSRT